MNAVAVRSVGGLLGDSPLPLNEARALLAHALGARREKLVAYPERELSVAEQEAYEQLLQRRCDGVPMAYLLGVQEFYGLAFRVNPAVLVPRPETEMLVDLARDRLAALHAPRVLDLGTGSGCIAIALALARPDAVLVATDLSADALAVAGDNAARHGAQIELVHGNWADNVAGSFDAILANPPYVAAGDPHLAQLRHEPITALTDGADGLGCLRRIVSAATTRLHPGGLLLLEHGHDQAVAVRELLAAAGFERIESVRDLAGIERICAGHWMAGAP